MDKNYLTELIQKYYDGSATIDEEKKIRQYVQEAADKNQLPEEFTNDLFVFKLKNEYTKRKSGSDIEIKLESFLDRKISQSSGPILNKPSAHLQWLKYVAAAAIIIATVISIYTLSVRNHDRIQDTFSDPQLAYQETQRVLMLVSTKINEGVKPLYNLEKMNEGTKHLHALNTIEKNLMILGIFEDNDNTDK